MIFGSGARGAPYTLIFSHDKIGGEFAYRLIPRL